MTTDEKIISNNFPILSQNIYTEDWRRVCNEERHVWKNLMAFSQFNTVLVMSNVWKSLFLTTQFFFHRTTSSANKCFAIRPVRKVAWLGNVLGYVLTPRSWFKLQNELETMTRRSTIPLERTASYRRMSHGRPTHLYRKKTRTRILRPCVCVIFV